MKEKDHALSLTGKVLQALPNDFANATEDDWNKSFKKIDRIFGRKPDEEIAVDKVIFGMNKYNHYIT